MIKAAITEKNEEIKNSLQEVCKKYNMVLEKTEEGKRYDIIINNSAKEEKAHAFMYIYNSDEEIKEIPRESLVISYGVNSLATATASSIDEQEEGIKFQYCLQREVVTLSGKKTEPQEFPVRFSSGISIHAALACVTFAIVCDISTNDLF